MQNLSNIPYDFLTIDREYLERKSSEQNISTGFPLILLLYSLILPILILCWVSTIRYLRSRGYITHMQENEIIHNIPLEIISDSKVLKI